MSREWTTSTTGVAAAAVAAALCLGLAASLAPELLIALLVATFSLLPLAAHARWVGVRRALTEPSAMTIIVIFYLFVFPLRGLAVALTGYRNVDVVRHSVSGEDIVAVLLLASLATTAMVEAFHVFGSRNLGPDKDVPTQDGQPSSATLAAGVMSGVALVSIFVYITQKGGVAATQAEQLSHSKGLALSGARSTALSLWAIVAVPAVWAAALVAVDRNSPVFRRTIFIASALAILATQAIVFGSRLDFLLAIIGAWVIIFFSGRRIPVAAVVSGTLLFILLSVPILNQRPGGEISGESTTERYSRIAGYSVLDAVLAVRQEPGEIRAKLEDSSRWADLPGYFAPSVVWPDRGSLESHRMDLFVAQSLGSPAQKESGLPTTYITELWIYGGWLAVVVASLVVGAALGMCHRRLVGSAAGKQSPANLLWYSFVVTAAFTYFKDGDVLTTTVGAVREGVYLGVILLVCGVWIPFASRRRRKLTAHQPAHSGAYK